MSYRSCSYCFRKDDKSSQSKTTVSGFHDLGPETSTKSDETIKKVIQTTAGRAVLGNWNFTKEKKRFDKSIEQIRYNEHTFWCMSADLSCQLVSEFSRVAVLLKECTYEVKKMTPCSFILLTLPRTKVSTCSSEKSQTSASWFPMGHWSSLVLPE